MLHHLLIAISFTQHEGNIFVWMLSRIRLPINIVRWRAASLPYYNQYYKPIQNIYKLKNNQILIPSKFQQSSILKCIQPETILALRSSEDLHIYDIHHLLISATLLFVSLQSQNLTTSLTLITSWFRIRICYIILFVVIS